MCLIAFAIAASSRFPLVLAANRDEFFDRPALPLTAWATPSGQVVLSGRDALAGGTWLGATPSGRVAFLTNVREAAESPGAPARPSRGELVLQWLEGQANAADFARQLDGRDYAGFNLVVGDLATQQWTWLSNRVICAGDALLASRAPCGSSLVSKALAPGIYGLSNAALDSPWPKTIGLKSALSTALASAADEAELCSRLWAALENKTQAKASELPATGLPLALEKALSSAFVAEAARGSAGYGTRCSTLLLVRGDRMADTGLATWQANMHERTWPSPATHGGGAHGAGGKQGFYGNGANGANGFSGANEADGFEGATDSPVAAYRFGLASVAFGTNGLPQDARHTLATH